MDGSLQPLQVALEELDEEIQLKGDAASMQIVGSRTVFPSLVSHKTHAFRLAVSDATVDRYLAMEKDNVSFGKEQDSERTFVVVRTVKELMDDGLVDWSTMGIILTAIMGRE